MAGLSIILGIIGNVISILMFASPIKTFKQVVKKKSTENYKGLPYITTLLSASLWTFYGVLKPGGLLVATVNGAGAALHVVYVILFLIYAPRNIKAKTIKLAGAIDVGFLGLVIVLTLVALQGGMRITLVGFLCAGLTIGMYAAPLASMRTVIRMKSVKYMPFFLSFFQFLNGGVWAAYAVLVEDIYLVVPNGLGFILGSAQLILYMIYRNKHPSREEEVKMEEEEEEEEQGSAHLFKGMVQIQIQDHLIKENDDRNSKNRVFNKGTSLPKPPVVRQYNHKIIRTSSLNPDELG